LEDIDTAVLRKGRTFDILELRPLKRAEALNIWLSEDLTEDEFNKEFESSSTVLQADLGSTIKLIKAAKEKNMELKPYIFENGISTYHKAKNKPKMGL
jgi:hypothetical protein